MKLELTDKDYAFIRDLTLSHYKELNSSTSPEIFWGQCAARAVVSVINYNCGLELKLDLPNIEWKKGSEEGQ